MNVRLICPAYELEIIIFVQVPVRQVRQVRQVRRVLQVLRVLRVLVEQRALQLWEPLPVSALLFCSLLVQKKQRKALK
jgi:hypothetical protein